MLGYVATLFKQVAIALKRKEDQTMPHVRIDWLPGRTVEQKRELAAALTREISKIGKCDPESVGIVFTDVSTESWATAGKLHSD